MSSQTIWRYMSLAKYIDLLRTKSLYFPSASCFDDETEGKWIIHSFLIADKIRLSQMKNNKELVEGLLKRSNNNEAYLFREVSSLLKENNVNFLLKDVLKNFSFYYLYNKPKFNGKKYLESLIEGWTKRLEEFPDKKMESISQVKIHRDSTYINCWNSASEMSLAMWQLFGGGEESVAIRTTRDKLQQVLDSNADYLQEKGYDFGISDIHYLSNLKNPDEKTRDKIMEILTEGKATSVAQFSIKPSEYEYENEVRGIIYPLRSKFDKVVDPEPELNGFSIPIVHRTNKSQITSMRDFIDEVHIHPLKNRKSLIFKVLYEIHQLYKMESIPIKCNTIEAFGEEINFE
ncbi:DUF2971 domain-containing protein [Halalkalibacter urbisdiaboli]|uniref:DUF2971 domain-containing protein n=1 Tax=Halalkalibacter urbisdiaboli TaxID=1960589 RepID=UPI000B445C5E|nr:DUF2971 domain-containing protein [Halalkalibacter urbisdiaboli]